MARSRQKLTAALLMMLLRRVAIAALFVLSAAAEQPSPTVTISGSDGKAKAAVKVEIADTPQKREVGLMHRKTMDRDAGMIFVFAKPTQLIFWMKDTEIPLDMIFIGADMRIKGIVEKAKPFSWWPRAVWGVSTQYVLEVNGGFCAQRRIRAGDRVSFSGFELRAAA